MGVKEKKKNSRPYVEICRNRDNGMSNLLSEVGLGHLLHLPENHGGDLLWSKLFLVVADLNVNNRLAFLGLDLEGEVLDIGLNILFFVLATY